MFTFNANYNLNVSFDGRKLEITQIIWILNSTEMKCKGPNVEDALHGTHSWNYCSNCGNNKGGDGVVVDNVEIMAVRAVPNGIR
jgi:hypothetical protein